MLSLPVQNAAPADPADPFAGDSGIFLCVPEEISLWI